MSQFIIIIIIDLLKTLLAAQRLNCTVIVHELKNINNNKINTEQNAIKEKKTEIHEITAIHSKNFSSYKDKILRSFVK